MTSVVISRRVSISICTSSLKRKYHPHWLHFRQPITPEIVKITSVQSVTTSSSKWRHFRSDICARVKPQLICLTVVWEIYNKHSIWDSKCDLTLVNSVVPTVTIRHDDVIKWKHFPRNWPFVWGIHRSPVNSPHKGRWRGALMFSLICVWINGWVNNRKAGDLRRYRAHNDVIVLSRYSIWITL